MTAFDPKQATLQYTAETPLLFASCSDAATGRYYGAGIDAAVYALDTRADKPAAQKRWKHHDNYISGLAWLSGTVLSSGYDRRIVWTHAESGKLLRCQDKHHAILDHLQFLPEQNLMIGGGGGDAGPFLGFWNVEAQPADGVVAPIHKAKPKSHIHHFVFDPAGPRLLAVGHGGFQLWDFSGKEAAQEDKKE